MPGKGLAPQHGKEAHQEGLLFSSIRFGMSAPQQAKARTTITIFASIMAWHDGDARQQGQSALLGLPLCLCQAKCRLPQGLKPTDGHVCSAPAERTWGEGNQDQDHPMEGLSRAYAQHLGPVAPDKVDQRAVLIPKVCNDSLLQQSILAVANDLNLLRRRPARYSTCEHQVHQARRVRKGWHMPHAGPA